MTAVVFVFGGVGPGRRDPGVRGAVRHGPRSGLLRPVLLGLVRRTQAATAITHLRRPRGLDLGSLFVLVLLDRDGRHGQRPAGFGPIKGQRASDRRYLNPFIAQADVLCGTEDVVRDVVQPDPAAGPGPERRRSSPIRAPGRSGCGPARRASSNGGVVLDPGTRRSLSTVGNASPTSRPSASSRDRFWPKTVVTWLVLSPCSSSRRSSSSRPPVAGGRIPRAAPPRRSRSVKRPSSHDPAAPAHRSRRTDAYIPVDPRAAIDRRRCDPLLFRRPRPASRPTVDGSGLRRIVRRAWIAVAAVRRRGARPVVARRDSCPSNGRPSLGAAIPVAGALALLVAVVRARPSLGETAMAVDARAAWAIACRAPSSWRSAFPASAGPRREGLDRGFHGGSDRRGRRDGPVRAPSARRRAGRPPRRSARTSSAPASRASRRSRPPCPHSCWRRSCSSRTPRTRPSPSRARSVRRRRQAERLDDLAKELETKGADAQDPRTRLAQQLRDLARQLRDHPDQLDVNLARLGSIEADVRAQIDPANGAARGVVDLAEPGPVPGRDRESPTRTRTAIPSRPRRTSTGSASSSTT